MDLGDVSPYRDKNNKNTKKTKQGGRGKKHFSLPRPIKNLQKNSPKHTTQKHQRKHKHLDWFVMTPLPLNGMCLLVCHLNANAQNKHVETSLNRSQPECLLLDFVVRWHMHLKTRKPKKQFLFLLDGMPLKVPNCLLIVRPYKLVWGISKALRERPFKGPL